MGGLLLLLAKQLSPQDVSLMVELTARSSLLSTTLSVNIVAANLADYVRNNVLVAAGLLNATVMRAAVDAQSADLVVRSQGMQGIMADFAFHQHSKLGRGYLQSGSYGSVYVLAVLNLMLLTQDTSFALSPSQTDVFQKLLLDGMRWMITPTGSWDWQVLGRSITRPGALSVRIPLPTDAAQLANMFLGRSQDAVDFANEVNGWGLKQFGNRYFASSDYMSHRRKKWMVSWRGTSSRTLPSQ